jgi:hypothetical protein
MAAKKRSAQAVPAMPLSEVRMMKALLATSKSPARARTTRKPATTETPKTDLTTLRQTIIDKLQVLALRRPQALIILAQVLDELLGQRLRVLDEHLDRQDAGRSRTKTRVGAGRTRHDRR